MKYFRNTILLLLLLAMVSACSSEEEVPGNPGELKLTLNVPGAEVTRSVDALKGESTLSGIYLLFYPKDAAGTELPAFFYHNTSASATGTWQNLFRARDLSGLTQDADYDVYALASLPADAQGLTGMMTKADFFAFREKQFDRTDAEAPGISFSGTGSYKHDMAAAGTLSIDLVRTVARFDITLTNAPADVSGSVTDGPLYTFYQPGQTPAPAGRSGHPLLKTGGNTFRGYVYENPAESKPVSLEFAANGLIYTAQVKPNETSEIKRNHIYTVTLAIEDEKMVAQTGDALDWEEVVSGEAEPTPIITQPKANTYIIAPGSIPIRIPVAQVNDASAFDNTVAAIAAGEELTAELVWTDVAGAVSGKGLAADAAVADIAIVGSGPGATLIVTPGSQPGNAVVAVKSDKVIKWSWHIWVTDYDPETEAGQKTFNGYTFMDRNLGAMSCLPDNTNANRVVGNYYQWGRKDPFPTKIAGALSPVPAYKADGGKVAQGTINAGNDRGAMAENPYSYETGSNYLSIDATALETWGASGDKTPFDPCPVGWRVPRKDAYAGWDNSLFPLIKDTAGADAGFQGENTGFFPYTWRRDTNGAFANTWNVSSNWTANAVNRTTGTWRENYNLVNNLVGYGHPVRCVRDWTR